MDPSVHFQKQNWEKILITGPLTDQKIAKYQKRGYYTAEFRAARKELMVKKAAKRKQWHERNDNFRIADDGRLIYSPL